MFLFGHVGITLGAVQSINLRVQRGVDLRRAAFLAIAADFIDKPVGLLYPNIYGNHTRLYGHSLVFLLTMLIATLAVRRWERRTPDVMVLWCAYAGHLLLDQIWAKEDLPYLFWPFFGSARVLTLTPVERWSNTFVWPYNLFGECFGLLILAYLFLHYELYRKKNALAFLRTGLLTNFNIPRMRK